MLYGCPLILFLHTLGLSTLVGLNSAINLRLLGFASRIPLASPRQNLLADVGRSRPDRCQWVLLFAADATSMLQNPAFLVKLVFVLLAVTTARAHVARVFMSHNRLSGRILAAVSLACWFGALSGPPDGLHRRVCLVNLAHPSPLNHFPTAGLGIALGLPWLRC